MFSRATCWLAMAMSSVSALISDCEGVPGQQSRCTPCNQRLRGRHSHPGQWKSELQDIHGTLADTGHDQMEEGFLSFVRLIGTVYFKKHLADFTPHTPRALYMSLAQNSIVSLRLLERVCRVGLGLRMSCPPHLMPCGATGSEPVGSQTMWNQAASNHMRLLDLTQYGWKIIDGKLSVIGSQ